MPGWVWFLAGLIVGVVGFMLLVRLTIRALAEAAVNAISDKKDDTE